jgi:amino acid transporter
MTALPLVGALYFMVAGGPYGLEELASKVGFGLSVAILFVLPLVWSLPTALMVGELAAALPEEGGYYVWVGRSLGPFWGFQEAWLSLAASVFDMAIYPTLFVLYLGRLFPPLAAWPVGVGAAVLAAAAGCNLAGAKAVGEGSALTTALLVAPFAALAALALGKQAAHGGVTSAPRPESLDFAGGVLVAMWNTMGWDNASTVADEVHKPQRTYPLAVLSAVALVTLTYVLPLAAMWFAHVDASTWSTGSWVDAARAFGGTALAASVVVGGMVSAFAMSTALCLSYSRLPAALADAGYLPRVFAKRLPRSGAPWASVLACTGAWTLSLGLSFERLVSLDILLYGASLVLEFVALAVLRVREPSLARPFRVPGGPLAAAALGLGPLALMGFALAKNYRERMGGMSALAFGVFVMLLGPVAYAAARKLRGAQTLEQGPREG